MLLNKTTKAKKIWLFLAAALVLAGCGGSDNAAKAPPRSPNGPAVAQESSGFGGGSFNGAPADEAPAAPQSAPASKGDSSSATSARRERNPDTRPGLGTEWGETRTSRVHDVTFVRESSRPFALATLHYNDRKGVDAMANLHSTREAPRRDVAAGGGAVTIAIKDAGGSPLEALRVGDRTMVIGQAGQRYSIVLTNHTSHRFESVVTVDGLDVINGKPGTAENRGYVLLPFATLEIEGFRQSNNAVAAFRFASVGESYAAQTGSARNVGVIGVAFFGERGDSFTDQQELRTRDTASPFPADPRFAQPPRR